VNYGRELRIEADIRRKEKVENNKVCRENEEDIRESRGSTKEGIGRDEAASR